MAETALQLITKAYYLSQVVSRQLQVVSGEQVSDGLELLNALLDIKGSDLRLIPYYSYAEMDTVNGQELYFLENVLSIDSLTFNIGVVRYPMKEMTRREYFATGRVDNISSLPFSYRQERCLGGTNLYLYFLPAGVYQLKYMAKFGLTNVSLTQDLSLTYDGYYLEYLRFALGEYLCLQYGATFPDLASQKYKEIRKKLMDINPPDLSVIKRSYFNSYPAIDWQMVNIPGWVPN